MTAAAQVQIADAVFDAVESLSAPEKARVLEFVGKLRKDPSQPSLSLERLARGADLWSGRVSKDLRAIIHRDGAVYSVVHVDHHDAAYEWAARRAVGRHPVTGALQIVESVESVDEARRALVASAPTPVPAEAPSAPLFAAHADAYLSSLGVPSAWLLVLREVRTEDQLLQVCERLPPDVAERLVELSQGNLVTPPTPVAPDRPSIDSPDTRRRFFVADDEEELRAALAAPHDRWIAFLHPSQRSLAEGTYRGPVKVTGGAGTGKTVVALHRARHLARQGLRVLVTSYLTTLCRNIERSLDRLVTGPERERISVSTVDAEALAIARSADPGLHAASDDEARRHLDEILKAAPVPGFEAAFVRAEWSNVVHAHGIGTWDEYRAVRRTGRGRAISVKERKALWTVFDALQRDLARRRQLDFPGLCRRAAELVTSVSVPSPYDAVLVDEVQDLRPPALRFLKSLCDKDLGRLMLLGDTSQRIYAGGFSLGALGIEVRGRSHVLRLNYRCTEQIRRAAERVVGGAQDDMDGGSGRRTPTRSLLRGPRPTRAGYATPALEVAAAVATLGRWIAAGFAPESIAVFARAHDRLDDLATALGTAGIAHRRLADAPEDGAQGVALGTLHRAKGLEFRAVLVFDASRTSLPSPAALRQAADPQDREDALARERQLLHVGMSRARDELAISWTGDPSPFLTDLPADLFEAPA